MKTGSAGTAMSETIPDAILAEARALDQATWDVPTHTRAIEIFAQALLAAEKRGAERERELAAGIAERFDGDGTRTNYGRCIASTIRGTET